MFEKMLERFKGKRPERSDEGNGIAGQFRRAVSMDTQSMCIHEFSLSVSHGALEGTVTDLRLDPAAAKTTPHAAKEIGGNRPIWDFLRSEHLAGERAFAVLGPPGCGKSTLLRHIALVLAQGKHERVGAKPALPLLLRLAEHPRIGADKAPNLARLLEEHYGQEERFPGLELPSGWLAQQLQQGQCLVLLDGIDEFTEVTQRQAAARWLARQLEAYPACRFIVTGRPQGYREIRLERPKILEIQPLRGEQVRRFLEIVFTARITEESRERPDEASTRQLAARKAGEALAWLRENPALISLSSSALLLSALVQVYRQHGAKLGATPGATARGRMFIYARMCEALLEMEPGPGPGLPSDKLLSLLAVVGENMTRRKMREIKAADLAKVVAPVLTALGLQGTPEDLCARLRGGYLLQEGEPGRFRFAHPSLQEYLAAAQMARRPEAGRQWQTLIGDAALHDTLVLYSTLADASGLVQACLAAGTIPALALCADALDAARQIDAGVQAQAEQVVKAALEDQRPKVRRQAGDVRLFRRLRSLYRMEEGREIDLDYVTCAEYQLFLDDMKERGHCYQPDHWDTMQFPPGQALQPITGIRPEDARDFCIWLTLRQGGSVRFRLPRPDEARLFPAQNSRLSTHCNDGSTYSLTGMSSRAEQAIMAELAKLPMLKLPPTLPLERCLQPSLDHAFNRALLRAIDIQPDPVVERSLNSALDHVRDMVLARTIELGGIISPDLDLARVMARACGLYPHISAALDRYDLRQAERLLDDLLMDSVEGEPAARFGSLLKAMLPAIEAETAQGVQRGQRAYLAKMAELVYEALESDESLPAPQRRQLQQPVMEFFAWLQIVIARSTGALPSWEGLRVVREQGAAVQGQTLDLPAWAYSA